jgi:quercetin dioxygenase-like cupin family protein
MLEAARHSRLGPDEHAEAVGQVGLDRLRAVRFVRRALGAEAFGLKRFELPPGAAGREHDGSGSGQEEVAAVVRGSGHWHVDGDDVPVTTGSFIRFDPESTRVAVAGPKGMVRLDRRAPRLLRAHGAF